MSRRWWLRLSAAVGSIAVGYAFSRIAAENDNRMGIFLFVVVSIGLFIVLSGLAGQVRRKK
jgi:hypothetical protein